MKFFLMVCLFSFVTLSASVEKEEVPVKRLYATFKSGESIVLLDKNNNKHIITLNVKNFYGFRKIDNHWIAQVQTKNKKWGLMKPDGSWLVKPTFDELKAFSDDNVTRVKQNGKWFFLKSDGKSLLQGRYNYVSPFREGLAVVQDKKGGLFYYINLKGQKVFKKSFSSAQVFARNGLAAVAVSDSLVTVYDVTSQNVVKSQTEGKTLWGFMNKEGQMVVKPQFSRVKTFNDFNISAVNDKAGNTRLIDMTGKYIGGKSYKYLWGFTSSGVAWSKSVGENSFTGYIDTKAKEIWKASYHNFSGEHSGLLVNERNGFQVFDPFGKLVIKKKSTWLDTFSDGNVSVGLRDAKWGIVSNGGIFKAFSKEIIAPLSSNQNWAIGFVDGLIAMINEKREIVYFDRDGVLQYTFKSNEENKMTLYGAKHEVIWQSDINKTDAYPFLNRGAKEHFTDESDYGKGIYKTIEKLLTASARKYHIPNFIYSQVDDPYNLSEDVDEIKKGAIKIVARAYVGETEWSRYDYLSNEGDKFSKYKEKLESLIVKKYGKPLEKKYSKTSWKIAEKILNLEEFSDSGDGDFYNMLVLEVEDK